MKRDKNNSDKEQAKSTQYICIVYSIESELQNKRKDVNVASWIQTHIIHMGSRGQCLGVCVLTAFLSFYVSTRWLQIFKCFKCIATYIINSIQQIHTLTIAYINLQFNY